MIGLDTNVLARYIMQDDVKQAALASRLVESLSAQNLGFVPLVVVVELSWVLISAYKLRREDLALALEGVLRSKEWVVEKADTVWQAVRLFKAGSADFADCLIARSAAGSGCEKTMTFDKSAAKTAGMTLLG
jgi:predicted nucleic-acid-binding protein